MKNGFCPSNAVVQAGFAPRISPPVTCTARRRSAIQIVPAKYERFAFWILGSMFRVLARAFEHVY